MYVYGFAAAPASRPVSSWQHPGGFGLRTTEPPSHVTPKSPQKIDNARQAEEAKAAEEALKRAQEAEEAEEEAKRKEAVEAARVAEKTRREAASKEKKELLAQDPMHNAKVWLQGVNKYITQNQTAQGQLDKTSKEAMPKAQRKLYSTAFKENTTKLKDLRTDIEQNLDKNTNIEALRSSLETGSALVQKAKSDVKAFSLVVRSFTRNAPAEEPKPEDPKPESKSRAKRARRVAAPEAPEAAAAEEKEEENEEEDPAEEVEEETPKKKKAKKANTPAVQEDGNKKRKKAAEGSAAAAGGQPDAEASSRSRGKRAGKRGASKEVVATELD